MTKREICERLLAIWEMEPYKNTAEAIKHLLLDIAVTEDHFADAGKMACEEGKSPVLLYEKSSEKMPCPGCGAPASHILNTPGMFRCKRCGVFFCREKRREEGK